MEHISNICKPIIKRSSFFIGIITMIKISIISRVYSNLISKSLPSSVLLILNYLILIHTELFLLCLSCFHLLKITTFSWSFVEYDNLLISKCDVKGEVRVTTWFFSFLSIFHFHCIRWQIGSCLALNSANTISVLLFCIQYLLKDIFSL